MTVQNLAIVQYLGQTIQIMRLPTSSSPVMSPSDSWRSKKQLQHVEAEELTERTTIEDELTSSSSVDDPISITTIAATPRESVTGNEAATSVIDSKNRSVLVLFSSTCFHREQVQNTARARNMLEAHHIPYATLDASLPVNKERYVVGEMEVRCQGMLTLCNRLPFVHDLGCRVVATTCSS
jgi:hypothetical protein